ncbi:beta/gamma crystallin-related protein [Ideonella sp.]|uniref:beta/gamma crystallin-related protein n=1 Tax=Ideonella sp. TaxID=1929293 RepID=UPI003BB681A9
MTPILNSPPRWSRLAIVAGLLCAGAAQAQVTFYQNPGFGGRSFSTGRGIVDFGRHGLNDRASSVVVQSQRWEVCENTAYRGHCVVLRPGRYASLSAMGLNNTISSVRAVGVSVRINDDRYAPFPYAERDPTPNFNRRGEERLYEANVISVRAVVGPPERRCWIERDQYARSQGNAGGALFGAVLGGILGHQLGSGSGQGLATAGGAVVGAAVGANLGDGPSGPGRGVERCAVTPSDSRADYWDVSYEFRGQQHRMQMTQPPGPTVRVNRDGEPRT